MTLEFIKECAMTIIESIREYREIEKKKGYDSKEAKKIRDYILKLCDGINSSIKKMKKK